MKHASRWVTALFSLHLFAIAAWGQSAPERGDERTDRMREFLTPLDKNKDGLLTRDEIPEFALRSVERLADRRNLNLSQPLPLETLLKADEENRRERRDERTRNESSPYGAPAPGFAQPLAASPALSFSVPLTNDYPGLELEYDAKVRDHMNREVLRRYDRNGNGMLEIGDETKDGRWSPELSESDTNQDGRLDKAELLERYAKKFGLPRKAKGSVAALGSGSAASSSNGSSSGASTAGTNDKVRDYARGLLNRYDSNKNGVLEKEEWQEMKPDYHAADLNKDNVITLDELAAKLAGYAKPSVSTSTASPAAGPPSSSTSATNAKPVAAPRRWWENTRGANATGDKGGTKQPVRFLTPLERLPKGLPDWFLRSDTNSDGQVMMSEYATSWSETTVTAFGQYDLDSDGIITPEECLAVEKTKKK
jgi:Ca2+-binding EF-hand superfamily protein